MDLSTQYLEVCSLKNGTSLKVFSQILGESSPPCKYKTFYLRCGNKSSILSLISSDNNVTLCNMAFSPWDIERVWSFFPDTHNKGWLVGNGHYLDYRDNKFIANFIHDYNETLSDSLFEYNGYHWIHCKSGTKLSYTVCDHNYAGEYSSKEFYDIKIIPSDTVVNELARNNIVWGNLNHGDPFLNWHNVFTVSCNLSRTLRERDSNFSSEIVNKSDTP